MKPKSVTRREMLEIAETLLSFGLWDRVSPVIWDVYQAQHKSPDPFQDFEDFLKENESKGTASIASAGEQSANLTMAVAALNQVVSQNNTDLQNHGLNYFVFLGTGSSVPLPIGPAPGAEGFALVGVDNKGLYTGTVLANGGDFQAGVLGVGNYYGMENVSYHSPLFGVGSTPEPITMLDLAFGPNDRIAGLQVGGGVYETPEGSGNYFYIRGETGGVHYDLGFGFSSIPFLYLIRLDKYRW